ncbi:MAG: TIGR02171 family protein [Fibrobacter sp.]|nr:TIGR02171 family protein [Fibrobacter sp.]
MSTVLLTLLLGCSDEGSSSAVEEESSSSQEFLDSSSSSEKLDSSSSIGSSGEEVSSSEVSLDSLTGMAKVFASGKKTYLGTDEESAKASDRPKMAVTFDYDFYMGVHEVTCGEFNKLMKKETGLQDECDNDSLPVSNVSYYDAVLYANARSKQEGLDTAYTYTSATFDEKHNCTGLGKLNFLNSVEGFRLPSEAEWVFVAGQEWNVSNSWNNGNSDYERHKVCSKKSGGQSFCDFAGNVMEWVNDWKGSLQDTSVQNYMGAPDGGSFGERVVKGGSFRNDISSINLFSRGDVYTVTSATKAGYVGFRLALGKVKKASWMDGKGNASTSRTLVKTSVSEMSSMLGTYHSKLAFRNDLTGNISFVDFAGGNLSVIEIRDTLDCYHPEISPDGKWVAFSTKYEGESGQSSLYVRHLDSAGTNRVGLDVASAAIPRWRVLNNGDTVVVYVSDAGSNKVEVSFKEKSTWLVTFANGKFGTPQKILDGSFHGGISNDKKFAVTGSPLLRISREGKDSILYDGEQACNVSLAPFSKKTLFLDFGGKPGRSFVGEKYGVHQRLFIADSNGKLIQSVGSPRGFSFDHSEWIVGYENDNFAVVSLSNVNGAHSKIALVNLADSSIVELVDGDELWHPSLWAENHSDIEDDEKLEFDPDSAGAYFREGGEWFHEVLRAKMGMFWEYKDSIEILAVGSSRMEDGLVSREITSGFCLNMGHPANDMNASVYVTRNYGFNHLSKIKAVVISLDFDLWQNLTGYTELVFGGMPGYNYDSNHGFWKDGLPKGFVKAVSNAYPASPSTMEIYASSLGYKRNGAESWGTPLVEMDSSWAEKDPVLIEWQFILLEDFLRAAAERNVIVVGVVFPQNPEYASTGSWGRYGPTRSTVVHVMERLDALTGKYGNFAVLDENEMGAHDYDETMALNTDHLSYEGATRLTAKVDSLLHKLLD